MIRLFLFLGLHLFCFANEQISFLWELVQTHRQNGDLDLEEMSLREVLRLAPEDSQAISRLKQIELLKKSEGKEGMEQRIQKIETLLQGESTETRQSITGKSFASEDEEAQFLESSLRTKNLTENQKVQIRERLGTYYFRKGMEAIKTEEIRRAIESLEKSISYHPAHQLSYYELGFLYFRIRELQKGIENLEHFEKLQPAGILSKSVKETLLNKYMSIARKYYYKQDFGNCRPYLEKIIRLNSRSPEAETALVYLMNLYFYLGMKYLKVDDYSQASVHFIESLRTLSTKPDLDTQLFKKLAKHAVDPFIKYGQKLFILEKNYGSAFEYFRAVTWLVPGSSQSFLAKEYIKEINRLNGKAENPVVYFDRFIEKENQRFLLESRRNGQNKE